jgi:hypothetical protein
LSPRTSSWSGGRCADTKARNLLPPAESGDDGRAEAGVAVQNVLVDLAIEADRLADVAGIEILAAVDHHPECVGRPVRAEHLGVDPVVVDRIRRVDGIARLRQHPPDEIVELGQRLDRRVDDERLELLPFGLPFVVVKSGFDHTTPPTAPSRYLKHPAAALNSPP